MLSSVLYQKPMFMFLSMQAPHNPMQVPRQYMVPYEHIIRSGVRRTYAGMVSSLDEAVRNVTMALDKYNMRKNTVLIFSSGRPNGIYGC